MKTFEVLRDEALEVIEEATTWDDDLEFEDVVSIAMQKVWDELNPALEEYQNAEGWGTSCLECGSQLQANFDLEVKVRDNEIALQEMNTALNEIVNLANTVLRHEEENSTVGVALLKSIAMRGIYRAETPDAVQDIHYKTKD